EPPSPACLTVSRLLPIVPALALSTTFVYADNWDRFRGPAGSGIANDKNIPVQFTAKDAVWKTEVPGIGHSSPIVWGRHLFLQSSSKDGKERWILCYDVADGKELWKRGIPAAKASIHALSSWAS